MSQITELTPLQTRFLKRVKKDGECWIWEGSKNKTTGYGLFELSQRMISSHRASYKIFIGDIPNGFVIHHICHIKLCVNPDHLQAMTQKENLSQNDGLFSSSLARHNSLKTHCPKGHQYAERIEKGKKKRYCFVCREINNIRRNNKFAHIDPLIIRNNIKKFEQIKLLGIDNNVDLKRFIIDSRQSFGRGAFDSALRVLLAQNGVLTYSGSVERARRSILKALSINQMSLEEMGVTAGFKITKTQNHTKPVQVMQESS